MHDTGGWKWRDDSPVDFFYWGGNEPNGLDDEECVEMYPWNGQWNDLGCFERRGFICKKPKGRVTFETLTALKICSRKVVMIFLLALCLCHCTDCMIN